MSKEEKTVPWIHPLTKKVCYLTQGHSDNLEKLEKVAPSGWQKEKTQQQVKTLPNKQAKTEKADK